jgi:hypothetical protein
MFVLITAIDENQHYFTHMLINQTSFDTSVVNLLQEGFFIVNQLII